MSQTTAAITTFNRAHFLGDAIRSVLAQTLPPVELIVLDNSSKDNTEEVVKSFADPRIRYVRHEPMPISPQRNIAVEMAQGDFIGFLDDDDVWLPNKLTAEHRVFEQHGPGVGMTYGGYQFFDETGVFAYQEPAMRGNVLQDLLMEKDGFCGSASNPLLRVAAIKAAGLYDPEVRSGEDYHLYLKMARDWSVEFTPEMVVSIRQHNGPRLIGATDARIRLEEQILEEFADVMDRDTRVRFLKKIGGKYVRWGKPAEGRAVLQQALQAKPADMEAWAQYAVSFLGKSSYGWLHAKALAFKKRRFMKTPVNTPH